jgi:CheY-like chemotaxis protein
MKKILVACDRVRMDAPLRRSLAHLVKSCEISVVHDGYAAFDEISAHPFDLIVADFQLAGIDSLELVESLHYIDPGVPVILMLRETHKSVSNTASHFRAHPIVCPFKPLKFLRLVDKLLHQQLNRYRHLASTLETVLETLCHQVDTPCTFLVENNGQVLVSKGEIEGAVLEALGNVAVGLSLLDEELKRLFAKDETLHTHYQQAQKDHGLYVINVIGERLRLALLSPLTGSQDRSEIWQWLEKAAIEAKIAFDHYNQGAVAAAPAGNGKEVDQHQIMSQDHVFIPLSLEAGIDEALAETAQPEDHDDSEDDEVAVNWQIISSTSNLLTRLRDLSQSD